VGQRGLTEGITVRTIVDRFLEHSRVFHFRIDDRDDVFITSTDVMPRNFDWRIEVMLPVEDEALKRRVIDEILGLELRDDAKASVLQPDGTHRRTEPSGEGFRAQAAFMDLARARAHEDAAAGRGRRRRGRTDRRAAGA
jgi:polyphosphate kinase